MTTVAIIGAGERGAGAPRLAARDHSVIFLDASAPKAASGKASNQAVSASAASTRNMTAPTTGRARELPGSA